jgi:hypothetical protein
MRFHAKAVLELIKMAGVRVTDGNLNYISQQFVEKDSLWGQVDKPVLRF